MDISRILKNKRLARYLGVAIFVVGIEMVIFQLAYLLLDKKYLVATIISFIAAVCINWVLSRKLVFGSSRHHPSKEFLMVLIASVVGLAIQTGVVYTSVSVVGLYPLFGKILSIGFSFFWNYWFRSAIVYKHQPTPAEEIGDIEIL